MTSLPFYGVALVSSLALAACGPSSASRANRADITGSVSNIPMNARSAIARFVTPPDATSSPEDERELMILISDKRNTCASFHPQNSTNLTIIIAGSNLTPGTYPIAEEAATSPAEATEVDFNTLDRSCNDDLVDTATSGTVTLDDVIINLFGPDDSVVSGTIDATFEDGRLVGDFDALLCPDAAEGDPGLARAEAARFGAPCEP